MNFKLPLLSSMALLFACNASQTVSENFSSGLTTKGEGLTAEEVYLTVADQKADRTTFIYGEEIALVFNGVTGFNAADGISYPAMEMILVSEKGDTVFYDPNLYADNEEGLSNEFLELTGILTLGTPVRSDEKYNLIINISDTKGEGTFTATQPIEVTSNKKLKIAKGGLTYENIYLYSENGRVVTDNSVWEEEEVHLIVEGLDGFTPDADGKITPVMYLLGIDASGDTLLNYPNLLEPLAYDPADVRESLSASMTFSGDVPNPVACTLVISDLHSDKKITVKTDLMVVSL